MTIPTPPSAVEKAVRKVLDSYDMTEAARDNECDPHERGYLTSVLDNHEAHDVDHIRALPEDNLRLRTRLRELSSAAEIIVNLIDHHDRNGFVVNPNDTWDLRDAITRSQETV